MGFQPNTIAVIYNESFAYKESYDFTSKIHILICEYQMGIILRLPVVFRAKF